MTKYREYIDIDEEYFPQINDSSIKAAKPDFWMTTYPHKTFIDLLNYMERILARQIKRSIWIEGAYGTGKSQCAYALKEILDVTEDKLRSYWDKYEPLRKKQDLLEKLIGHKNNGVLTVYRYASGDIFSPRELFLAIQESVKKALKEKNLYEGENTLKENVIAWIEEPTRKNFFNELLKKDKWRGLFSQSTVDEILNELRNGKEVKELMNNLFLLADKEGVKAFDIDADTLISWLTDVIDVNNITIVLIWDEFTDYFKNNIASLSEFQKIVEFVSLKPFYLIVVTHQSGHLFNPEDSDWKKVQDRFEKINIELPDNIAFELIGHAFKVKQEATNDWKELAKDLNDRVETSRAAVINYTKISDQQIMMDIMPIHPMAALVLKNIASAFKSNQRSMFDFIKSPNTDDEKAFQWFIQHTGPHDDHPLLTVDMLWDFFYERNRDNLDTFTQSILDTYSLYKNDLKENEQAVLKAILIMQAVNLRNSGDIEILMTTEQHLSYVFEGITNLENYACINIAKELVAKRILITTPVSGGKHAFIPAIQAGDQEKIDKLKEEARRISTTAKLVNEGEFSDILNLTHGLSLRFESEPNTGKIIPVTESDFTRIVNSLSTQENKWKFHCVIAFAKDDREAAKFRKTIQATVEKKQYENIVFIDALSTPLGPKAFEEYVDYVAMALYYKGNNNSNSDRNRANAESVLKQDWKNRIYNGQFIVYTYTSREGVKLSNAQGVLSYLQTIVSERFPYIFDFSSRHLNEVLFKLTSGKISAQRGIEQRTVGIVSGLENEILPTVWKTDKYWEANHTASLQISKIKMGLNKLIENAFLDEGQISIDDIYDFLVEKYGFAPCNLYAFLTGFLLKEYGNEQYRFLDSAGLHGPMNPSKLAEMINNYMGKYIGRKPPKPCYIMKITKEEEAFYKYTEQVWGIEPNSCTSASQMAIAISDRMRRFGFPVWTLFVIDKYGVTDIIKKYIELVQNEGNEAHKIAIEIGKIAISRPTLFEKLVYLVNEENFRKGMIEFLKTFEDGKILTLASEIGAEDSVLTHIRELFEVKHFCLWDEEIGKDEIRKLLIDYGIARETNNILNSIVRSSVEAFKKWRDRLNFFSISYEVLVKKNSTITKIVNILLKICKDEQIISEQKRMFYSELKEFGWQIRDLLNNDLRVFKDTYGPYIEDLSDTDINEIKSKLPTGMFSQSHSTCNLKVKEIVEEYRKKQLKTQLSRLWREKTETENPRDWSKFYRTPILCCVPANEYEKAKKSFETINRSQASDLEIRESIDYLKSTSLFEIIKDENLRNEAFAREIIGEYRPLLQNIKDVRDALDRLAIDTYDWRENPTVKNKVKQLAEAEYNAGGIDKIIEVIDSMEDAKLKLYLKELVKKNMIVGMEIISNGGFVPDDH